MSFELHAGIFFFQTLMKFSENRLDLQLQFEVGPSDEILIEHLSSLFNTQSKDTGNFNSPILKAYVHRLILRESLGHIQAFFGLISKAEPNCIRHLMAEYS